MVNNKDTRWKLIEIVLVYLWLALNTFRKLDHFSVPVLRPTETRRFVKFSEDMEMEQRHEMG